MSLQSEKLTLWQELAIKVVKTGRIPRHVAIILDGNRRFAKNTGIDKCEAYEIGLQKVCNVVDWCGKLGIKEVSLYCFSVENFKRPKEEVDFLMYLFAKQCNLLFEDRERLKKDGIRYHIQGDLTLFPVSCQKLASRLEMATKNNRNIKVNMCAAYTSRHELSNAANTLGDAVNNHDINGTHLIGEKSIDDLLGVGFEEGSEPDVYIRTSGEVRLSDYLLWQSGHSILHNIDINWPEFSVWHFLAGIIHYQSQVPPIIEAVKRGQKRMKSSKAMSNDDRGDWDRLIKAKAKAQQEQLSEMLKEGYNYRKSLPPSEE